MLRGFLRSFLFPPSYSSPLDLRRHHAFLFKRSPKGNKRDYDSKNNISDHAPSGIRKYNNQQAEDEIKPLFPHDNRKCVVCDLYYPSL